MRSQIIGLVVGLIIGFGMFWESGSLWVLGYWMVTISFATSLFGLAVDYAMESGDTRPMTGMIIFVLVVTGLLIAFFSHEPCECTPYVVLNTLTDRCSEKCLCELHWYHVETDCERSPPIYCVWMFKDLPECGT